MTKVCQITGKQANTAHSISHSNKKTRKIQNVNLHKKKIWCTKNQKWIKITISTKGLKSLLKI